MFDLLQNYREAWLSGVTTTLQLAAICWLMGLFGGTLIGHVTDNKTLKLIVNSFGFLISSIPVLVMLYWFHYPLQASIGFVISPFVTSAAVLGVVNIFMVANTISHARDRVPKEFSECAQIYGVMGVKRFFKIDFPLIIRTSLPSIINIQVSILHMTLFTSLISLDELFRTAQRINSLEYRPIEIFSLVALFYLVLSAPLIFISRHLSTAYMRDFSER